MATNGKLSAYGELYEGNFDEWKTRLKAWVSYRTGIHDVYLPNHFEYLYTKGITSEGVATHICFLTSPAMLERVPLDLRSDCEELLRALEDLAKPFRLIELPAEIRNMIYEKAMPEWHWVVDTSDDVEKSPCVSFPSLLHTSMQIRQESLSIFYSTVIFCMDFTRTDREVFLKGSAIVESWSTALVKVNLKHLHCIRLWTTPDSVIDIQYSEDKGLTCDFDYGDDDVPGDCALLVKEHVQALESTRKALGLKGEAIVMALLSNWTLWWTLYEKLKD